MRIIPAIDIIDGKCVRLTKGDYTTKKILTLDRKNFSNLKFEDYFNNYQDYMNIVEFDELVTKI